MINYTALKPAQKFRLKKDLRNKLSEANKYLNELGLMINDVKIVNYKEKAKINLNINLK